MDRVSLEQMLGHGLSLAEIGRRFGRHEATVSYWVKKYGLEAVNQRKHAARGGIAKQDLETLVAADMSIARKAMQTAASAADLLLWRVGAGR